MMTSSAPIAGVGTSTAGFVGLVRDTVTMPERPEGGNYTKVPAGEPSLVTNWEEFKNKFGDVQAGIRRAQNAGRVDAAGVMGMKMDRHPHFLAKCFDQLEGGRRLRAVQELAVDENRQAGLSSL